MSVVQEGEEGHYENVQRQRKPLHPNLNSKHLGTSAFASKTQRGKVKIVEAPPPGAYDVAKVASSENWSQGKKGLLGSGAARFKRGNSTQTGQSSDPGPGQYSIQGTIGRQKSALNRKGIPFVSTQKRFANVSGAPVENDVIRTPGPGSYDVDPLYGNFNKRTFNMTIAEQESF